MEVLTRELQVLGELYHQQREEAVAVLSHGSKQHEWKEICNTLREEKEGEVFRRSWLCFCLVTDALLRVTLHIMC